LWHIHTKWDNPGKVSELTAGCSFAKTGNHLDPDYACGPNSDHIKEMTCAHKTYGCNTTSYAEAPGVCEKGDLSGKFGTMKAVSGKISETWIDTGNYPTVAKHKDTWSIVLQAVCGTAIHHKRPRHHLIHHNRQVLQCPLAFAFHLLLIVSVKTGS
ncbi:hypothetical protein DYB37_013581, partial [Aphanomyces astaci]